MNSEDRRFDEARKSDDPDRDWVITELRSGNPTADDHPVHRRHMTEQGHLVAKRAYASEDLFAPASDAFALMREALAMQSWSAAFTTFLLHGFWVRAEDAENALHSLRGHAEVQMAERLVRTRDWLANAIEPVHSSHPDHMVFLAAGLPAELRPERGVLTRHMVESLSNEREALLQEVRKLRQDRFAGIAEEAGERHKTRPKRVSEAVTKRAETYLAVVALDRFKGEPSSLDIARRVIELTKSALANREHESPPILPTEADALTRRLKTRWDELGLSPPDGRKASKQTVK